uniref:Immunoglobulin V-set domain-containing protein n=1 Tax=Canis lupus familiaris TaxID=9615 RepID=A0A8I3PWJ8_CANLF
MAWTHLLLPVLTLCTGSVASSVLTQPPFSISVSGTDRATISCSGESLSKYYAQWFSRRQAKSLCLVIYKDTDRGPLGSPDRFYGSSSGNHTTHP